MLSRLEGVSRKSSNCGCQRAVGEPIYSMAGAPRRPCLRFRLRDDRLGGAGMAARRGDPDLLRRSLGAGFRRSRRLAFVWQVRAGRRRRCLQSRAVSGGGVGRSRSMPKAAWCASAAPRLRCLRTRRLIPLTIDYIAPNEKAGDGSRPADCKGQCFLPVALGDEAVRAAPRRRSSLFRSHAAPHHGTASSRHRRTLSSQRGGDCRFR